LGFCGHFLGFVGYDMTELELFKKKVKEYRVLANRNQADLAAYLGMDYTELSNRLNGYKNTRLSHENVRTIVRALAEWGAITTQAQACQLLDLMAVPYFDAVDWQAAPLDKLKIGFITSNGTERKTTEDSQSVPSNSAESGKWPELDYGNLVVTKVILPPDTIPKRIGLVNSDLLTTIRRVDSLKTFESEETLTNFYVAEYNRQGWSDISAIAHLLSGFREVVSHLEEAGGFSIVFQKRFLVSAVTMTPALLAWSYFPELEPDEKLLNIVQLDLIGKLRPK
jgi:transcriptional regulator with XRE-family HTH domain